MSHRMIDPSRLVDHISRPSGENTVERTTRWWPVSSSTGVGEFALPIAHKLMLPSVCPTARSSEGVNASDVESSTRAGGSSAVT